MPSTITYSNITDGIDWVQLKSELKADSFDNGRTPDQLRGSFENSAHIVFAWCEGMVVGKARVLSDGVCNAYLVDVWTKSEYRKQGIATEMIRRLTTHLNGQHIYLQADDDLVDFYTGLGFEPQPHGLSRVVGYWLNNE